MLPKMLTVQYSQPHAQSKLPRRLGSEPSCSFAIGPRLLQLQQQTINQKAITTSFDAHAHECEAVFGINITMSSFRTDTCPSPVLVSRSARLCLYLITSEPWYRMSNPGGLYDLQI